MTAARQFGTLFVEAYRDAAAAGSDMRLAADLLEHARAVADGSATTLEGALLFAEWIASTVKSEGLCAILGRVRDAVLTGKLDAELANFRDMARSDMATGHVAWLEAIGRALGEVEVDLAQRYANAEIGIEPRERQRVADGVDFARKERWRQSSDVFGCLAGDARLLAPTRARLLAILAEIDLLFRSDTAAAHAHLREAEALNAKDWRIAYMRGQLFESSSEPSEAAKAEEAYKLSDSLSGSRRADPLIMLGNLRKAANEMLAAEELYVKACARALGVSRAYIALIELSGHPSLFSARRGGIDGLVRRATLVGDNADTYDALVRAAEAMRSNGDFDEFKAWNDRAIEFDASRTQAYLSRAYANLDRSALDAVAEDFERVIAIAPEDPEGWWGKANLARERKDWATQRDCAVQALRRAPDWSAAVRSELERTAISVSNDDPALARSLYDTLRQELGEPYEAAYQNQVANLHFYHGEYDKAVERCRKAVRAAPSEAIYLANLALSLLQLKPQDYTEALDVAQRASALDPQNADYTRLHRDLENRQEFVRRFGSAAQNFKHDSQRVRVQASSPLLAHLIENDDLQPWLKQRIAALRETITQSHGFTLQLIRFTPLLDDDKDASFALEIGGQVVCSEHFDAVPQDAMQPIEAAIRSHLSAVFGHGQAREAAGRCGDRANELVADPVRLNAITATGRALLAAGKPLDCAELLQGAEAAKDARPALPQTFPPAVAIAVRYGAVKFDDDFASGAQAHVFERTGVLIPLVVPEREPGLPPGTAFVSIDGAQPVGSVAATKEAVNEALANNADRLLDAVAVACHLVDLETIAPDLVKVVRAVLPLPELMPKLRLWLAGGGTLTKLPFILETLALAEAAVGVAASAAPSVGSHTAV